MNPPQLGKGHLVLNLLFSARAAKFFKLRPPQLLKLKDWSKSWDDPDHHWISNWRCEECFSMKGTEERVFIVSNGATRLSFLFKLAPGDVNGLFLRFHAKLMESLKKCGVQYPSTIELQIATLSGAAASLTGFQNNIIYYLDHLLERGEFTYLDDLEPSLNLYLTKIEGEYRSPVEEFARRCGEDPPFSDVDGIGGIGPLMN